jgi:hypothetical protein
LLKGGDQGFGLLVKMQCVTPVLTQFPKPLKGRWPISTFDASWPEGHRALHSPSPCKAASYVLGWAELNCHSTRNLYIALQTAFSLGQRVREARVAQVGLTKAIAGNSSPPLPLALGCDRRL